MEDVEIDRQLSDRLVMPILETIGAEIKQLIFIPDGAVNFLPIGNLLVGSETRLFQKVGFLFVLAVYFRPPKHLSKDRIYVFIMKTWRSRITLFTIAIIQLYYHLYV
jgi:CHAT domain-containing protein